MNFTTYYNTLIDEANERGRKWARTSAALTVSSEDREYLEKDAKAMARRLLATPFDPTINPEDRLLAEEHDKTSCELEDAGMAQTNAALTLKQREDALVQLGAEAAAPVVSPWLIFGGTALFASGFAVGIYDWIHDRLLDAYLAALVALAPSVALGIFVVRSLTHPDSPGTRTMGLIAGIGISIATGILRYAFASDEWIVALALSLLELFIVLLLDWHGSHLQTRYQKWLTGHEERGKRSAELDAARQQNDRIAQQIVELKNKVQTHHEHVNLRALCFQKLPEIETALFNAILAGAHRGIAENQGLKRGVVSTANALPKVM